MPTTENMGFEEPKRLTPWEELERMARAINPDLPKDLTGYVITISMGKNGCYAHAIPALTEPPH